MVLASVAAVVVIIISPTAPTAISVPSPTLEIQRAYQPPCIASFTPFLLFPLPSPFPLHAPWLVCSTTQPSSVTHPPGRPLSLFSLKNSRITHKSNTLLTTPFLLSPPSSPPPPVPPHLLINHQSQPILLLRHGRVRGCDSGAAPDGRDQQQRGLHLRHARTGHPHNTPCQHTTLSIHPVNALFDTHRQHTTLSIHPGNTLTYFPLH